MNTCTLVVLTTGLTIVPLLAQENSINRATIRMAIQKKTINSTLKTVVPEEQHLINNLTIIYNTTLAQDWFDKQIDFSIWSDALSNIQTYVKQYLPHDMDTLKKLITLNEKLIKAINIANERIFQPMQLNEKVANQTLITFASVAQNAHKIQIQATNAIIQDLAYKIFIAANTGPDFFQAAYAGVQKIQ